MNLQNVNSTHLKLLTPLLKWRVLDLGNLKHELNYQHSRQNFEKTIRRLDKSDIIKSFIDPWSRKKFIYLTKFGATLVGGSFYDPQKDRETYFHDSKVGEITRELIKKKCLTRFNFESANNWKHIPIDVLFDGESNNINFKMGLILKFITKVTHTICSETRNLFLTSGLDYLLYFFCNESSALGYKNLLERELDSELFKRVMFFYNPTLLSSCFDLNLTKGFFKGRDLMLSEVMK